MIDTALRTRACALGSDPQAKAWGWLAWAQLGYDVAATGIGHYTLATRELWPGQRPGGEEMDRFRAGFAAYRHGWRRPDLHAGGPKPLVSGIRPGGSPD